MHYPKVKFARVPIDYEVYWFDRFLRDSWGWGKKVLKAHPELAKLDKIKSKELRKDFLRNYILKFNKKKEKKIAHRTAKHEKEWRRIEKMYFKELSCILEIGWPKKDRIFNAMISINVICPRFLDKRSFMVFYNFKKRDMLEMIMHECCHFLYFEKWKEVFPEAEKKTFNSPHIEWHLSEILAPVILNDKRIRRLLGKNHIFMTNIGK